MRFPGRLIAACLAVPCALAPVRTETSAASVGGTPLTSDQERGLKPKDRFRECENCPEMVVVPAGSFTMGAPNSEKDRSSAEGPQHEVTIRQPFAAGQLHVTVDQYSAFVQETGYEASSACLTFEDGKYEARAGRSWRNPGFAQEGSHPVVCVSWDDARAYVDWIAKKTGKPYRLLSEAEFEYAARGRTLPGMYPRFWFGDDEKDLCRNANGGDQRARDSLQGVTLTIARSMAGCDDGYAYTSPAGRYTPNAFGLYDMAGNAWQWTADCGHGDYHGAPSDGSAWTIGSCITRVARGGAWNNIPWYLRAASRGWFAVAIDVIGFRVARTLTS